jgi:hypothetical protein
LRRLGLRRLGLRRLGLRRLGRCTAAPGTRRRALRHCFGRGRLERDLGRRGGPGRARRRCRPPAGPRRGRGVRTSESRKRGRRGNGSGGDDVGHRLGGFRLDALRHRSRLRRRRTAPWRSRCVGARRTPAARRRRPRRRVRVRRCCERCRCSCSAGGRVAHLASRLGCRSAFCGSFGLLAADPSGWGHCLICSVLPCQPALGVRPGAHWISSAGTEPNGLTVCRHHRRHVQNAVPAASTFFADGI